MKLNKRKRRKVPREGIARASVAENNERNKKSKRVEEKDAND